MALPDDVLQAALLHEDVAHFARRLAARVPEDASPTSATRFAAVAAVLRIAQGQPELLFIKRAEREHDPWSGHMAFPGGRQEDADASLEVTAMRETREELSLDLSQGLMLGRLDDLAPRSRMLPDIIVRPFVALVLPTVRFQPNAEIAATFWVPLEQLRRPEAQVEHVTEFHGARAQFPAYLVEQHVVWGLTERIVRQLLELFHP